MVVPRDRIFVMGDHRDLSADSRCHLSDVSTQGRGQTAFVPVSDVVGPAFAIVSPFDRAKRLHVPATFADVPAPTEGRTRAGRDQACGRELLSTTHPSGRRSSSRGSIRLRRDSGLYGYERALHRAGLDPVAGADEAGPRRLRRAAGGRAR